MQIGCLASHCKQIFIQKMTLAFLCPFRSLLHLSIGSSFKVFLKNIITHLVCIHAALTALELLLLVGSSQTSVWGFYVLYRIKEIWKYRYGNYVIHMSVCIQKASIYTLWSGLVCILTHSDDSCVQNSCCWCCAIPVLRAWFRCPQI